MERRVRRWWSWVQRHRLYAVAVVVVSVLILFDGVMSALERLVGAVDVLNQFAAFLRTVDDNVWAAIGGGLVVFALIEFTRDRRRYERRIAALNRRARLLEGKVGEQRVKLDEQEGEIGRVSQVGLRVALRQEAADRAQELRDRQARRGRGPTIG